MEQPVIAGTFSYAEATQILGQCALGKKVISHETKKKGVRTDWGLESALITEPVYANAWISLADSSVFLWSNLSVGNKCPLGRYLKIFHLSMFFLFSSFVAWPVFVLLLCKKSRHWPFDN